MEDDEKKLIDDIEKHGCHIIQVRAEDGFPGWSYTVGLTDLLGCPEIIVIGLKNEVAHWLLNECSRRLQAGVKVENGSRVEELLVTVECEFRSVERKWLKQTMGYAVWFYGGDDFEVLQCVYPDHVNRFPSEADFDSEWRARQPLLFAHALSSTVEAEFWAANDPQSSLHNWKFVDPPHTGVYTTKRVMSGDDPITRVFHDVEDGAWQFHGPPESKAEDLAYVCFHHIVDKDLSITELADLPVGWSAWRDDVSGPWQRAEATAENDGLE
jgi:hypothetical protein